LATSDSDSAALKAKANRAMAAGDVRTATALLEAAASLPGPGDVDLWISLAGCRRGLGDANAAMTAVDRALALEPRHFFALLMRASLLERMGEPRAAGRAYGIALTQAPPAEALDEITRRATEHARQAHARYLAEMESALTQELGAAGAASGPERRRISAFVDRLVGKRRVFHQEPVQFNYPNLPEIEFLDREDFPSLAEFEAQTDAIRAELERVLAEDAGELAPYVNYPEGVPLDQWSELNRSPSWSAYHLLQGGAPVEDHARRCPATMAAIGLLDQPRIPGRSPSAMFSVLKPRTRIPPHTGVSNTRLVLHLPLILPPGCGFRVGGETRAWREGEAWVFDDTIEHEAWNDSDLPRTVLICDLWNPRLSASERELITAIMVGMDRFSGAQPISDGL
jgi:aspartyl/asparaginyl beta-hydroxylase (cupin superfamily)